MTMVERSVIQHRRHMMKSLCYEQVCKQQQIKLDSTVPLFTFLTVKDSNKIKQKIHLYTSQLVCLQC